MAPRVLIVEDQESMALVLEHLVTGLGCTAELVGNGRADGGSDALEQIRRTAPDLVILAAELRGRSGFDIAQAIRADETLERVRLLVLSARSGRLGVEKAFALGADAFLPKPFAITDLRATVRALLGLDGATSGKGADRARS